MCDRLKPPVVQNFLNKLQRDAMLLRVAEQIRQWREEDARNGIKWGDDS